MKSRKLLVGTVAAIVMLILILDGRCALYGAAEGLELCIRTVIPSLFPFFFFSTNVTTLKYLDFPVISRVFYLAF